MTNQIDDGSGTLNSSDFTHLVLEKNKEIDPETLFKDTFRVFSKDNEGGPSNLELSLSILLSTTSIRMHSSEGDEVCASEPAWRNQL